MLWGLCVDFWGKEGRCGVGVAPQLPTKYRQWEREKEREREREREMKGWVNNHAIS